MPSIFINGMESNIDGHIGAMPSIFINGMESNIDATIDDRILMPAGRIAV
jgi:hypothetical protein